MFNYIRYLCCYILDFINKIYSKGEPTAKQLMSLMKRRRSIMPYKFINEQIPNDKILQLVTCANYAPTHKLTFPWRFIVIDRTSHYKLHDITETVFKEYYAGDNCLSSKLKSLNDDVNNRWSNVSHFIGICVKKSHKVPEWEEIAAVSCAVQNMLLMAPCLGIACYWSSWHSEVTTSKEMLEFLGMDIDNNDTCLGFLVLGQSKNKILYEKKIIPLDDITTWM